MNSIYQAKPHWDVGCRCDDPECEWCGDFGECGMNAEVVVESQGVCLICAGLEPIQRVPAEKIED